MRIRALAVVLVALLAIVAAGCGSVRNAPPLDDAERAELESLQSRLAGVRLAIASNGHADAAQLKRDIEALGLFGLNIVPVEDASDLADCAFTLDVDGRVDATSIVEKANLVLTVATLGIVPYYSDEQFEYRIHVAGPGVRESTTTATRQATAVVGWLGLPVALLHDWSPFFGAPPDHREKVDRLGLCIIRAIAEGVQPK